MIQPAMLALLCLLHAIPATAAFARTTRYWDCCKPSCSWPGKAQVSHPVNTCNKQDQYIGFNDANACDGGESYACSNQTPWAVDDNLAYGFAAAKLAGKSERDWCCACYQYVPPHPRPA
jgi:hypothetical protein